MMRNVLLGDMLVGGEPPAKLAKALAVISSELHPAFDRETWGITPGFSKQSCILASLAVRDFLWKVGLKDAQAAPVYFFVRAFRGDEELHSLGVGDHAAIGMKGRPETREKWNGHMAIKVSGWLVDTTLYQCQRPHWEGLPGMMAVPLETGLAPVRGHEVLAGGAALTPEGIRIEMVWLDQPQNRRWREVEPGDPKDTDRSRRVNVVKRMVKAFENWKD